MENAILFLIIGVAGWWVVSITGQDPHAAAFLAAEVSAPEIIMGVIGATIGCHVLLCRYRT